MYAFAEEGHTFFGVGVYVLGLELRTVIPTLLIKRGPTSGFFFEGPRGRFYLA